MKEDIKICNCRSYHKELISYLDALLPLIDKMYMLRDLEPVNPKDFPEYIYFILDHISSGYNREDIKHHIKCLNKDSIWPPLTSNNFKEKEDNKYRRSNTEK